MKTILTEDKANKPYGYPKLNDQAHLNVTGSFTGSFTGNFNGSGADLFDIPSTAIVGLNLSQITSGSVSASISPDLGLQVNTNITATSFSGSFSGSGNFSGILTVGAYTLPSTDGSSNQVLKTNGSGTLSWQNDSGIALTSLSATTPLSYNNTTGVFSISKADTSTNGYLSSTDWNTFNDKQAALGFTPENIANKKTTLSDNSDTYYPTQKAVKTAVDAKQDTITGGASTITSSNLTANRALLSDANGKVAVSSVTNTELGYVGGVTSSIQTQLNNKLPSSSLSLATGQVAFGSGTNTIGGDNGLYWDNTNKRLGIGNNTPTSALTISGDITPASTATQNIGAVGKVFSKAYINTIFMGSSSYVNWYSAYFVGGGVNSANDNINLNTGAYTYFGANVNSIIRVGVGVQYPSARLHLAPNTSPAGGANLKFSLTSAALLSTKEIGAFEAVSDRLYFTDSTNTRNTLAYLSDVYKTPMNVADSNYTVVGNEIIIGYTGLTADRTCTLPDPASHTGKSLTLFAKGMNDYDLTFVGSYKPKNLNDAIITSVKGDLPKHGVDMGSAIEGVSMKLVSFNNEWIILNYFTYYK